MMTQNDTYKTITKPTEEVLFKDKNSKFFGYAFPVKREDDINAHLEHLKKQHHSARYCCYAYQLGMHEQDITYRANDDGEPNNSAGMPIYDQIQSFEVTNVMVVVVRYFGGVKLGVGGLISAYRTLAQLALESSKIVTKTINNNYRIQFEYKNMNRVMRIIKENNLKIINQTLEPKCDIEISVRKKIANIILEAFKNINDIKIEVLND